MTAHIMTRMARGERGLTYMTPKPVRAPARAEAYWPSAAKKLGISLAEYQRHRRGGELWCSGHRRWHPSEGYGRSQGTCRDYLREYQRRRRAGVAS